MIRADCTMCGHRAIILNLDSKATLKEKAQEILPMLAASREEIRARWPEEIDPEKLQMELVAYSLDKSIHHLTELLKVL